MERLRPLRRDCTEDISTRARCARPGLGELPREAALLTLLVYKITDPAYYEDKENNAACNACNGDKNSEACYDPFKIAHEILLIFISRTPLLENRPSLRSINFLAQ